MHVMKFVDISVCIFVYLYCKVAKRSPESKVSFNFSEFLKHFCKNTEQPYSTYFDYVSYMWRLAKDNPNILVVFFEDMKKVSVITMSQSAVLIDQHYKTVTLYFTESYTLIVEVIKLFFGCW